jgi:hypothetical protein
MLFAGKWMELEIIVLSKVSRAQKKKDSTFLFYVEARPKRQMFT